MDWKYYLTARDSAGNSATLPEGGVLAPFSLQVTFQDYVAVSEFPTDVWRMVSVPVQSGNNSPFEILSALGGYDINQWRLFRFVNGAYSEFTRGDIGGFAPGRALWLHTRTSGFTLRSGAGQTVPLDKAFEIALEPGWNDIAMPFAFAVQWDAVMQGSGDPRGVAGPYTYDGVTWSFPQATDRMEPWEGYAVKNSNASPVNLMIAPQRARSSGKVVTKTADEWAIQVKAKTEQIEDVHNYLGFRIDAQSDWDPWDLPEPPPAPGDHLRLYFPHRDWAIYPDTYTSDFRPRSAVEIWEFVVEGNAEEARVTLSFSGLESLPDDLQAHLLDMDGQVTVDLQEDTSYALTLGRKGRRFRIVVGEYSYLERTGGNFQTLPTGFVLEWNRPNPFNAETLIAYQVPQRSRVQVAIFDLLGRKVAVLAEGIRDPGYFSATWNGRDQGGVEAASGVYFYVLEAQAVRLKRKMVLVR